MIALQHIAVRMALGHVYADDIQATVDALLEEGAYSDAFISIMESRPACLSDVLLPFSAYLASQGILVPSKDDAVWQSIAYYVSRVVTGGHNPLVELEALISEVYWNYDFHSVTSKYLGDSHGIEHLVGLYWEYKDSHSGPCGIPNAADDRIAEEIVKRCKEWMGRFGNKSSRCSGWSVGQPAAEPLRSGPLGKP